MKKKQQKFFNMFLFYKKEIITYNELSYLKIL